MSAKIPRSALDATRFTSSLPHATSKPFPAATTATSATRTARGSGPLVRKPNGVSKLQPSPGPQGETPQEKVKRLRAAWDKARAAQETPLERIILKGRGWADRTHKVTVLSLLGFSGALFCPNLAAYAEMSSCHGYCDSVRARGRC